MQLSCLFQSFKYLSTIPYTVSGEKRKTLRRCEYIAHIKIRYFRPHCIVNPDTVNRFECIMCKLKYTIYILKINQTNLFPCTYIQHHFNVQTTSSQRYGRCVDVETTLYVRTWFMFSSDENPVKRMVVSPGIEY